MGRGRPGGREDRHGLTVVVPAGAAPPVPPGRTVPPGHDLLLPEEEAGGSRISADRPSRGSRKRP
ncbi:hypothetical protein B8281_12155 [Cellulosimicrobium sp. TH-20]|nr:hypothetical protein B8281_12155 [Cellulosimicrobium sp. TH-20]